MTKAPSRNFLLACGGALALHALLFGLVLPTSGSGLRGSPVPPQTQYLSKGGSAERIVGSEARRLWSPVLFSLPSEIGFSRELMQRKVRGPKAFFDRPSESEHFLEIDTSTPSPVSAPALQELMLTTSRTPAPALPAPLTAEPEKRPAKPRVYVAPELRERLLGGIVLPPELNTEVTTPWEACATVSVDADGMVRNVFLENPLEPATRNQRVLKLLYNLRFKSGSRVVGGIEIYSPGINLSEGAP